ncbi:MAG: sortase [Eubacteriales bacterium]|nr:sortase [Eubacteriales bacterium]
MASVKNTAPYKRNDSGGGLPAPRSEHHRSAKKSRRELFGIRALGLSAILLGVIALILLGVKFFEGEEAGNNAAVLLDAYKAKATVSPEPAVSPEASTDPAGASGTADTPEPTDENFEQTDISADATAAAGANEHLANDGSVTSEIESGEYVRPDAPEVTSDLDITIQKIIDATGEDGVIGILEIPELDEELPIIGKWSYKLLKISVCRYKGPDPLEDGNLVIIGHNYKNGSHFGRLSKLSVGSEIFLTNAATGQRVRYEVYQIKSIASDAFSALKSYHGDAGLTLMTCKDNGTNRLLVRCEQKDAS